MKLIVVLLSMVSLVQAMTFYVDPGGNDNWSGLLAKPNATGTDGPKATLTGVRDAIRQEEKTEAITIYIADGTYTMTEPLILSVQDSGTASFPITYKASPAARPVFTAGVKITGFENAEDNLWVANIPKSVLPFEQLYVNGQRAILARSPNEGFLEMLETKETVLEQGKGRFAIRARQTTSITPEALKLISHLSDEQLKTVNLVAHHKWDYSRKPVRAIDRENNTFTTEGEGMKPWNPWQKGTRFYFENFKAGLDAPGQWYLQDDMQLFYKPRDGENIKDIVAIAPQQQYFIILENVSHINFQGLTFEHCAYNYGPDGFEPVQAAATIDAAIMADYCNNIKFMDCTLGHLGKYAIWFRKGCKDCLVQRCLMSDLGAGGIKIGQMTIPQQEKDETGHITIDNNIIHSGGHNFASAVGIWIGHSANNSITHNDIGYLYYTGVSVGWVWGYSHSPAKNNKIDFNHIHNIGQGMLCDMAAVYTLGLSEGTTVSNNVVHNIDAYSYGGWGLYTDEGSTSIVMENNLVYNTKTGGFHQHYGKENIIRNNIFAFSKLYQIQASRVEPHLSFTFQHNIIYYNQGICLHFWGQFDKINTIMNSNCYYDTRGPAKIMGQLTLEQWQGQHQKEEGSIVADPLFEDPENYDFRLKANSPAELIGFKPFDYGKAGIYDWDEGRKFLAGTRQ